MVYHDPVSLVFKFSVYRKATNAESYIHFYSYHNKEVKQNIITNFALRALRICDPEYIDQEMSHIKEVFTKLSYPENFICKAVSKARRIFYTSQTRNERETNKYVTLPYNSKLDVISKKLNRENKDKVNIAFNYKNTIRSCLIRNNNSNKDNGKKIGVYEIPCKDCEKKYYGESGRGLPIRLTEHKRAYDLHAENNALVNHSLIQDHRIDWEQSKVIFNSKNTGIRRLVEGAVINCGKSMEGNKTFTQEDSFTNELVCKEFIKHFDNTLINHYDRNLLATSDAAASLSSVQVTGNPSGPPVTGAQAEEYIRRRTNPRPEPPPRRSRRIARLAAENTGIT